MAKKQSSRWLALRAAFPYTLPIFAGFWFLGLTYGVYMNASGFPFWYPALMSLTIFAGSMEFVAVNLLLGPFRPAQAFVMTLLVNARHLFYGISMLERYKGTGLKKIYLIFGLCDETFSINYSAQPPEGVDRGQFMFFVTLLNHIYWFLGAALGGICGSFIHFSTEGIGFVMTAMFLVIFLEQWKAQKRRANMLLGLALPALCLALWGPDSFMLPAMAAVLLALLLLKKPLEKGGEGA
ncbi:MAG TPA: AzlC family ABC transporter permease [Candidatus Aphodomonas merdavium]|nr:AzlC family ABC transporter permease [Candidatus Aphodomonas merdavium]